MSYSQALMGKALNQISFEDLIEYSGHCVVSRAASHTRIYKQLRLY